MSTNTIYPSKMNILFPKNYPDYVYNFAYGSNMEPNVLTGRRKIQPIESIPGVLEGWQLTFDLRGIPGIEPCFGNIRENSECEIHGVLHKMTNIQFKHLLETEGGSGVDPDGYIPMKFNVCAYDGRIIEAYALVVQQNSPAIVKHFILPSSRYIGLLKSGAKYHQIHPTYIQYLESLPSIERNIPITILVIIEILGITLFSAPIWIPVVFYYICTQQKAQARAFTFKMIVKNLWRIHKCLNRTDSNKSYSIIDFPLKSTDFKQHFQTFQNHQSKI